LVVTHRKNLIEETDAKDAENTLDEDDADATTALKLKGPSSEALSKMTDYREDISLLNHASLLKKTTSHTISLG
jgi:hypothetical protein